MTLRLNTETGLLPAGEHNMNWTQVCELFGGTNHRDYLLKCLYRICCILKQAGVPHIWLDGSFVTSKDRPNDYDMSYTLTKEIFARLPDDPFKLTDADRIIRARFSGDIRAEPMRGGALYHRDLFPNVVGHFHNGQPIEDVEKGIVVLVLDSLPDRQQLKNQ